MKAIRVHAFGDPDAMKLEEVPDLKPGPGEVVVRVGAAGINPVDTYIRSGTYHIKPPLPYTPGMDGAGTVESVGEQVNRVSVGDRVYVSGSLTGTYAEQALCEANQVYPLPHPLSFSQGAGISVPYTAACYALFHRSKALPGETILVHGATGGVGLAAVQFAVASGMIVIGTGGTKRGRDLIREQGVQHVLNHHDKDYQHKILELTGGKGVDVILEMLANVNLGADLPLLARDGRVVIIGSRGPVEINPRDALVRNAAILGMLVMNASEEERLKIHAALHEGMKNGTLHPVVGKELPLAHAPEAHRLVMEPGTFGKIVLIPEQIK
ncbi:MAG: NADPH:quinone reductase [Deltaproteobacteria bacterium]|nr:NADPH:quinone reductase [Deltaproteobacteria bacterium]